MRHIIFFILFSFLMLSQINASFMQESNFSYAENKNGETQIKELFGKIELAVQQNDLVFIRNIIESTPTKNALDNLPVEFQNNMTSYFDNSSHSAISIESQVTNWKITGFRDFMLKVESVDIYDSTATAQIMGKWSRLKNVDYPCMSLSVNFEKKNNKWYLQSLDDIITLVDCFVNSAPPPVLQTEISGSYHKENNSDRDVVFLGLYAPHLLTELDWKVNGDGIERATKWEANEWLEKDLVGCFGGITSFYWDDGNLSSSLVAASDECWRRILWMNYAPQNTNINTLGHHGFDQTNEDFCTPRGMEYSGSGTLYIVEDFNNRIKIVSHSSDGTVYAPRFITSVPLNKPSDLDVRPDGAIVVADTDNNRIAVFCDAIPACGFNQHTNGGVEIGNFIKPTSIAFGRDEQDGEKEYYAFFIDNYGRRIVRIWDVFNEQTDYKSYDDFPEHVTDLSSIAVDNKGQVWVTDRGSDRIYKFDYSLNPIAFHGYTGSEERTYLRPNGISFTSAYAYDYYEGSVPIPNFGEVALSEFWGNETGIRRLVAGTDIVNADIYYTPQLEDGTLDKIFGGYYFSGYSDIIVELRNPSGALISSDTLEMRQPSWIPYSFSLSPGDPSGLWEIKITAESVFNNSNSSSVYMPINIDRSIINYKPIVNQFYFPDFPGIDSCFAKHHSVKIAVDANDSDGTISSYSWSEDADWGYISGYDSNSIYFRSTAYPSTRAEPNFIYCKVFDNNGQQSLQKQIEINTLHAEFIDSCECNWIVSDADNSGAIDISDAIYIISYMFDGGPAPTPHSTGSGDADCSEEVDVSDAVYIINSIFGGGPPPCEESKCWDYELCEACSF